MPVYTFRDKETDEAFDKTMPYSTLEEYLLENPNIYHSFEKVNLGGYVAEMNKAMKGLPSDYKEKLRSLKKAYTTRTKKSTINDNL